MRRPSPSSLGSRRSLGDALVWSCAKTAAALMRRNTRETDSSRTVSYQSYPFELGAKKLEKITVPSPGCRARTYHHRVCTSSSERDASIQHSGRGDSTSEISLSITGDLAGKIVRYRQIVFVGWLCASSSSWVCLARMPSVPARLTLQSAFAWVAKTRHEDENVDVLLDSRSERYNPPVMTTADKGPHLSHPNQ